MISNELFKNGIAQEDCDFQLTEGQERAVSAIKSWYMRRGDLLHKNFFVLAGAAGTGKTSIISAIRQSLPISETYILCCAFTGKAALNLNRKGNTAQTLHSAIYNATKDEKGEWTFKLKPSIQWKFIIIDEASMISKELFDDVMHFGVPVVFIGDHCQLPPVNDDFNIMLHPDFVLTEIMRQAKESPIIRASQLAIQGKPIPYCSFKGFRKTKFNQLEDSDFLWAEQLIVGKNVTRHMMNRACRELRGFTDEFPMSGERMISLENNCRYHLFNGQIVYLNSTPRKSDGCFKCDWKDEIEMIDPIIALAAESKSFKFELALPNNKNDKNDKRNSDVVLLDFGYAITCHKSQGSGWERVIVADEGFGFDKDMRCRWMYTAITRAKEELIIAEM